MVNDCGLMGVHWEKMRDIFGWVMAMTGNSGKLMVMKVIAKGLIGYGLLLD